MPLLCQLDTVYNTVYNNIRFQTNSQLRFSYNANNCAVQLGLQTTRGQMRHSLQLCEKREECYNLVLLMRYKICLKSMLSRFLYYFIAILNEFFWVYFYKIRLGGCYRYSYRRSARLLTLYLTIVINIVKLAIFLNFLFYYQHLLLIIRVQSFKQYFQRVLILFRQLSFFKPIITQT